MPKRREQTYMIVKTADGYIKVDKDGRETPIADEKELKNFKKEGDNFGTSDE